MTIPALTPVEGSSNVVAIGYDAGTRTAYVQFKTGTYAYAGVDLPTWQKFQNAKSKGEFVAQQLKGNFKATKVTK